jgi:hypothetical protein
MKEIRIKYEDLSRIAPHEWSVMHILRAEGFPCDGSGLFPKPKAGLKYFEFHDHKTGEIVVQWEED